MFSYVFLFKFIQAWIATTSEGVRDKVYTLSYFYSQLYNKQTVLPQSDMSMPCLCFRLFQLNSSKQISRQEYLCCWSLSIYYRCLGMCTHGPTHLWAQSTVHTQGGTWCLQSTVCWWHTNRFQEDAESSTAPHSAHCSPVLQWQHGGCWHVYNSVLIVMLGYQQWVSLWFVRSRGGRNGLFVQTLSSS